MKTYRIEITETLQRTVAVVATDAEAARAEVKRQYDAGQIVLDAKDLKNSEIEPV